MSELKLTLIESEGGYKVTAADQNGNLRLQVYGVPSEAKTGQMIEIAQQHARRIVACVNAFEGVPDAALKPRIVMAQEIQAQELIAQRDELLEELALTLGSLKEICAERQIPRPESTIRRAESAIARAKGGAA